MIHVKAKNRRVNYNQYEAAKKAMWELVAHLGQFEQQIDTVSTHGENFHVLLKPGVIYVDLPAVWQGFPVLYRRQSIKKKLK